MSRLVMKLAIALLPPSRRVWGEAMAAEFAHLRDGRSGFALGCLGASLRENVMTGEGVARIGFGLTAIFFAIVTALWTQQIFKVLSDYDFVKEPQLIQELVLEGFNLFPIVFGIAAFKAISAPTNRLNLANIGFKTTLACLWVAGALQAFMTAALVFLLSKLDAVHHQMLFNSIEYAVYGGVLFLSVAWFSRHHARAMRKAGFIATLTLLGFAVLISIQNAAHPEVLLKGVLPTTLFFALLMALTTTAGALFMWMQRPLQPKTQS